MRVRDFYLGLSGAAASEALLFCVRRSGGTLGPMRSVASLVSAESALMLATPDDVVLVPPSFRMPARGHGRTYVCGALEDGDLTGWLGVHAPRLRALPSAPRVALLSPSDDACAKALLNAGFLVRCNAKVASKWELKSEMDLLLREAAVPRPSCPGDTLEMSDNKWVMKRSRERPRVITGAPESTDAILEKYLEGAVSMNLQYLVGLGPPVHILSSVQLIGHGRDGELFHAGNWIPPKELDDEPVHEAAAQRAATAVYASGYEGLVGIDTIGLGKDAFVVDVNPRLNGSTFLHELRFEGALLFTFGVVSLQDEAAFAKAMARSRVCIEHIFAPVRLAGRIALNLLLRGSFADDVCSALTALVEAGLKTPLSGEALGPLCHGRGS